MEKIYKPNCNANLQQKKTEKLQMIIAYVSSITRLMTGLKILHYRSIIFEGNKKLKLLWATNEKINLQKRLSWVIK